MKENNKLTSILLFITGVFFVALSSVVSVPLLKSYSSTELTLIRFSTVSIVVIPLLMVRREIRPPNFSAIFTLYVPLGLSTLAGFLLFLIAVSKISAVETTGIFFCFPFILVIFGFLFLKETISLFTWFQTFLGFLGVFIIYGGSVSTSGWPQLAALFSGVAVAVRLALTRRASQSTSPLEIIAWESIVSTIILLFIVDITQIPFFTKTWLLIAYLAMANLSRICIIAALRLHAASTLAPLAFFELLFVAILEGAFLGVWATPLNALAILAICIAGLGVALRQVTPIRQKNTP